MKIAVLLLAAFAAFSNASTDNDDLLSNKLVSLDTELEALKEVDSHISSGGTIDKDDGKVAIEYAMQRGWFDLSSKLLTTASSNNVDLSTAIHQTASKIRQKLSVLADSIQKSEASVGIPPAFEWAQSPDSIFLNVKFAHKLDTPATLGCDATGLDIDKQRVIFKAECKEKKKAFQLSLSLYDDIIPAPASSYAMASVGRAVLTLKKPNNATWPRLLSSNKARIGNMHIWWTMKEKLASENDAFEKKQREIANNANTNTTNTDSTSTDNSGADANTAVASEVIATPTPTPTIDPIELERQKLQQEAAEKKKRHLHEISEWEKLQLKTSDAEFRAQKKAIDEKCKAEKKAIDEAADLKRNEIKQQAEEKRNNVNKASNLVNAAADLLKNEL